MARNVEFNEEEAIKKAMDVFWRKGYSGTTLRDLTDAMQINSSSLYNTIGDKQQLFVKCIRNYTQGKMQDAVSYSAKFKSPLKAIIGFINESVNTILYSNNSCMAIKTTFEMATNDAEVQAILKEDNDFTHDFLLKLFQKAIELKEIDSETDAETLTDFVINLFTGWHESYILHRNPIKIKRMARFLITQISK